MKSAFFLKSAIGTSEERRHARIRVVRDVSKASFGRPFFTCSKEKDKCRYFEWGDEIIVPKPLCMHGKPCTVQKVKKESPNQGRSFLCCAEPIKESCNFFQWVKASETASCSPSDSPPKKRPITHFSETFRMPPPPPAEKVSVVTLSASAMLWNRTQMMMMNNANMKQHYYVRKNKKFC